MGETMTKAHRASPYISIANLLALLTLLAMIFFPSMRFALGLTVRTSEQHAHLAQDVTTNTADIANLKADNIRLEREIQQSADRNNAQYQQLNAKMDALMRLMITRRTEETGP